MQPGGTHECSWLHINYLFWGKTGDPIGRISAGQRSRSCHKSYWLGRAVLCCPRGPGANVPRDSEELDDPVSNLEHHYSTAIAGIGRNVRIADHMPGAWKLRIVVVESLFTRRWRQLGGSFTAHMKVCVFMNSSRNTSPAEPRASAEHRHSHLSAIPASVCRSRS